MPKLPSGRYVGLSLSPLYSFLERVVSGRCCVTLELLKIVDDIALYPYIAIVFFEKSEQIQEVKLTKNSIPLDPFFKPVITNLSITDILSEKSELSPTDKMAFLKFIIGDRAELMFEDGLRLVLLAIDDILASPTQQWEVAAWEAYFNPAQ